MSDLVSVPWDGPQLVGAVGLALAVEDETRLSAQVKWPGEVMLDRKQVASVGEQAVVDLGALRRVDGSEHDAERVQALVVERLAQCRAAWAEGGLDAIYEDLGARDFLRGRRVSVGEVAGVAVLVNREGALEIDTGSGHVAVTGGELLYHR